jgi:hypothetical protein
MSTTAEQPCGQCNGVGHVLALWPAPGTAEAIAHAVMSRIPDVWDVEVEDSGKGGIWVRYHYDGDKRHVDNAVMWAAREAASLGVRVVVSDIPPSYLPRRPPTRWICHGCFGKGHVAGRESAVARCSENPAITIDPNART